jgi:uncharacterized protein (DUF2249 family)
MGKVAAKDGLFDTMMADGGDLLGRWTAYEPKFKEFARVLSDEATARELRIVDVSRMLDVPVDDLLAIANGKVLAPRTPGGSALDDARPSWADEAVANVKESVDASAILGRGFEPLHTILKAVDRVGEGEVLMVQAPFHPKPLRRMLGGRGFESFAEQPAPDVWRAYFRRGAATARRERTP